MYICFMEKDNKSEIWIDLPNYIGVYKVSNYGRVKSLDRKIWSVRNNSLSKLKGKILSQNINGKGYMSVSLHYKSKRKTATVHVLVAICFLNHKQNGMKGLIVDHKDNNNLNNKSENLQLISNRINTSKNSKGTSKYTGVSYVKSRNKWISQIYINNKRKNLGYFDLEIDAHNKYQETLKNHLEDNV